MLQVITGMYFGDVALNATEHCRTLYTNADFSVVGQVDLPGGTLTPTTDTEDLHTALLEYTERLEAVLPDGTEDFMISTGGDEIADDLAVVLSFALNATFTPIREKADRLIKEPSDSNRRLVPADVLPRTFAPHLILRANDVEALLAFTTSLLALNRRVYEQAMRAMRRIVTASERVAEDPTLAYTDYVAALESLSVETEVLDTGWDRYPHEKKKVLDPVLAMLTGEQAGQMRSAILEAEKAGVTARYKAFVHSHIRPSFFREEAIGVVRPVTEPALPRLVAQSYTTRSKSVHELRELRRETWLHADGAHTADVPGVGLMLTHEGLNRLAWHVVRTFILRGSTELDRTYQWRDHLPNVIQVRLAPEFYLGHPETMTKTTAAARAGEFFGYIIEVLAGRDEQLRFDLRPVLEHIELMLATHRNRAVREPMLAIYLLWHRLLEPQYHRPAPDKTLSAALTELQKPSMFAFTTGVLLGRTPPWSVDDLCDLAEQRYEDMHRRQSVELPPRVDAALWALVAQRLLDDGAPTRLAHAAIGRAVKCSPGDEDVLAIERQLAAGQLDDLDLQALILGRSPSEH
ncbi:hypothetical protein ABT336_24395 [Micromonospora sp. NPDC000207]|uniref:hypothetical protein n=1 Tax=Micromonospora sp. NPDC000207 TaxID=3154246 RepID=UPI00331D4E8B